MIEGVKSQITAAELGIGQAANLPPEQRADNQNWTLAPWNRWSFQRVQNFTRTVRIPAANKQSTLRSNPVSLGDLAFQDSNNHPCTIDEMLGRTWTDGFMVLHSGDVATEQYFNGMRPHTLHLMMSCSKSFTSTLLGIYVEKGVIDPAQQLTQFIPELSGTGMDGATLQEALDMRVGVKFNEDYDDLNADWRLMEVATGWRDPDPDYNGPRDMVGYMQTLTETESDHGGAFHYKSILTDVVGLCLQRATGRLFEELFFDHIWNPLGTEQDLVSIIDSCGNAIFEGGFNVCLRDFARFAQMICQGGVYNGQELVADSWINQCRFPGRQLIDAFAQSQYGEALPDHAYHNKWWVRDPGRGVLMALGIHGQTMYIDPERQFVAVKFSSQPHQSDANMVLDQMLAFEAIADFVCRD